jgi:hypothetical protein
MNKSAKRYMLASQKVWDDLPAWKRGVIDECVMADKWDDRVFDEYAKSTIELAESEEEIFLTE